MKVKPINDTLKPILTAFLNSEKLQSKFKDKAKALGYIGDDKDKIRIALFTPDQSGEICFADQEIYDLFIGFQVDHILETTEPFTSIIREYPEIEPELADIAKRILNKEKVQENEISNLLEKYESKNQIPDS